MIGGTNDVYSKTCIGVRRGKDEQGVDLLILDPHYEGPAALRSDVQRAARGGLGELEVICRNAERA